MALRTFIAPLAAALFASAVAWTPAGAAIFGSGGSSSGSQSAAPSGGGSSGGGSFRSGGGGARSAPAQRSRNNSRGSRPRHNYNYRRGGYPRDGYRRHYGSGGAFIFPWGAFGAPDPSYYEDDGTIVCGYRRVRYHGRWVRQRYCWREYW